MNSATTPLVTLSSNRRVLLRSPHSMRPQPEVTPSATTSDAVRQGCVCNSVPVRRSQILSVLSSEAETACCPLGLTAKAVTVASCPIRSNRRSPDRRYQTLIVWSREADTATLPFALMATALIGRR